MSSKKSFVTLIAAVAATLVFCFAPLAPLAQTLTAAQTQALATLKLACTTELAFNATLNSLRSQLPPGTHTFASVCRSATPPTPPAPPAPPAATSRPTALNPSPLFWACYRPDLGYATALETWKAMVLNWVGKQKEALKTVTATTLKEKELKDMFDGMPPAVEAVVKKTPAPGRGACSNPSAFLTESRVMAAQKLPLNSKEGKLAAKILNLPVVSDEAKGSALGYLLEQGGHLPPRPPKVEIRTVTGPTPPPQILRVPRDMPATFYPRSRLLESLVPDWNNSRAKYLPTFEATPVLYHSRGGSQLPLGTQKFSRTFESTGGGLRLGAQGTLGFGTDIVGFTYEWGVSFLGVHTWEGNSLTGLENKANGPSFLFQGDVGVGIQLWIFYTTLSLVGNLGLKSGPGGGLGFTVGIISPWKNIPLKVFLTTTWGVNGTLDSGIPGFAPAPLSVNTFMLGFAVGF